MDSFTPTSFAQHGCYVRAVITRHELKVSVHITRRISDQRETTFTICKLADMSGEVSTSNQSAFTPDRAPQWKQPSPTSTSDKQQRGSLSTKDRSETTTAATPTPTTSQGSKRPRSSSPSGEEKSAKAKVLDSHSVASKVASLPNHAVSETSATTKVSDPSHRFATPQDWSKEPNKGPADGQAQRLSHGPGLQNADMTAIPRSRTHKQHDYSGDYIPRKPNFNIRKPSVDDNDDPYKPPYDARKPTKYEEFSPRKPERNVRRPSTDDDKDPYRAPSYARVPTEIYESDPYPCKRTSYAREAAKHGYDEPYARKPTENKVPISDAYVESRERLYSARKPYATDALSKSAALRGVLEDDSSGYEGSLKSGGLFRRAKPSKPSAWSDVHGRRSSLDREEASHVTNTSMSKTYDHAAIGPPRHGPRKRGLLTNLLKSTPMNPEDILEALKEHPRVRATLNQQYEAPIRDLRDEVEHLRDFISMLKYEVGRLNRANRDLQEKYQQCRYQRIADEVLGRKDY